MIDNTRRQETRVVLTGDGEWRGTFAQWATNNADGFSLAEIEEAGVALDRQGWHLMNMGAGGVFLLRLESKAERELLAALKECRCVMARLALATDKQAATADIAARAAITLGRRPTMTAHPVYVKAKAGEWIRHADVAALLRTTLKRAFPGVRFGVTTKTYSGGGSVSIHWEDGPTEREVEAVADAFETAHFDGSIDLAPSSDIWLAPNGSASLAHDSGTAGSMGSHPERIGSAHHPDAVLVSNICSCYVHCSRKISPTIYQQAIDQIRAENRAEMDDFDWNRISGQAFDAAGSRRFGDDWLNNEIWRRASRISAFRMAATATK